MLTIDENGIIVAVNGTTALYANSRPESLVGKPFASLMPPGYAEKALSRIREAINTGKGYETEQKVNFMGVERLFSSNIKPITIEGHPGQCVLIVSRDITEKSKIDDALRKAKNVTESS